MLDFATRDRKAKPDGPPAGWLRLIVRKGGCEKQVWRRSCCRKVLELLLHQPKTESHTLVGRHHPIAQRGADWTIAF